MDSVRFGGSLRALRRRPGWRQLDLANKSACSQSQVSRIELGQLEAISVGDLNRISTVLGARLDVRILWNGEALDRLLDAEHADLVESIVRRLEDEHWEVAVEVSFAIRGERGSIDVLAWHRETRSLLVVEAKTVVPDLGAMLMSLDGKARLAPSIARDREWSAASVSRLLLIRDGTTQRRRVEQHEAVFRRTFPVRGRDLDHWLLSPGPAIAALRFLPVTRRVGGKQRIRIGGTHPRHARAFRSRRTDGRWRPTRAYHPPRG